MKIKLPSLLLLFLFILFAKTSCTDKCEDVDCFTPPSSFDFNLVSKTTAENLFTNGTYEAKDIKVINLKDNSSVEHQFSSENGYNTLSIHTIGWKTEVVNYAVTIATDTIFKLNVDAARLEGECCTYTQFNSIDITEAEYELDDQTGVYVIKVED